VVFWAVTPCSDMPPACMTPRNIGILPQQYTVSQSRRPRPESSSLWQSQVSENKRRTQM